MIGTVAMSSKSGRLLLGAVLTIIAVSSGGCGGGDDSPPAKPAPRQLVQQPPQVDQTPAAAKTPPAAAQPSPGRTPGMPGMPGEMGMPGHNKPEPKPEVKRDQDVSKWKTADYYNAKKENDPKLFDAVQFIAGNEKSVGNKTTAAILIKLLTAEEPKEEPKKDSPANKPPGGYGMDGPGMGGPVVGRSVVGRPGMVTEMGGRGAKPQASRLDRRTIEAIVIALAINGSAPAKKALRDVVLGTLKTDDDSAATQAALATLVENQSPENEAVLFRALTEPEKLRPKDKGGSTRMPRMEPGGMGMGVGVGVGRGRGMGMGRGASGKLSADALREMALDVVEPVAPESFRLKLASYLLKPGVPSATINVLSSMLIKPHPSNIGPQLLLFQSSAPDPTTKAKLAGFFTEYSETALAHLLGILKHTKPFNFNEQLPGKKPSPKQPRTEWGEKAATTGWGNPSAASPAGRQPHGMEFGTGSVGERGMGGYANRPGPSLNTRQLIAADPEMPARIAKKLWSPNVVGMIKGQLTQASLPSEAGLIIPLARTIPNDDVRAGLHRLMQTHWEKGSRPFLSGVTIPTGGGMERGGMGRGVGVMGHGGMMSEFGRGGMGRGGMGAPGGGQLDKPVCDPGFLVLVKMLPIDQKNQKQNGGRKQRGGRPKAGAGAVTGLGVEAPGMGFQGAGRGGSSINDWQKVHENLLFQFIDAFQTAARLNRNAQPVGTLPISLHTTKGIDMRFDLKWPESAPKQSGLALDPIEIHYVKIIETADPEKVWKTYSRNLKTKGRMLQQDRVALLDTIQEGSAPGRKLSVDVLITRQQPGMAAPQPTDRKRKKKNGEPLTVEILTIEMNDPDPPAPRAEAEKPAKKPKQ